MYKHSLPPLYDGRTRYVSRQWLRDPNGPVLKKPPPKGIRTPNNLIWGHDLLDFFWIQRIPGVDSMAVWTRSMIKQFGENYDEAEFKQKDLTHVPRLRHPWPLLKVPKNQYTLDTYGEVDQGCEVHHRLRYRPKYRKDVPDEEESAEDEVDEEFDRLVKAVLGVENEGVFARNNPKAPLKSSDGRAYTILWSPSVRDTLPNLPGGVDVPLQTMCPYPFTVVQMDGVGMHVLTALDDDALEQLGGPSLPLDASALAAEASARDEALEGDGIREATSDVTMQEHEEGAANTASESMPDTVPAEIDNGKGKQKATEEDTDDDANVKRIIPEPITMEKVPSIDEIPLDSPYSVEDVPKLEETIPVVYFPDYLQVHDPQSVTTASEQTYGYRTRDMKTESLVYKRVYPKFPRDEPSLQVKNPTRIAHLHLAQRNRFGVGNHSIVHHAPLTLPEPLSAHSRNGRVVVAAKTAFSRTSAREFLQREAKMYDTFPSHLSEEWCGYNLMPPIRHPVPVGPVVPKFYGYYVPMKIVDGKEVLCDELDTTANSPILLIEECGEPVQPAKFTVDMRAECYALMCRLHLAGFVQNSFSVRNILVQPGPLTVPPAKRSDKTPSFRVIDFGRGVDYKSLTTGRGMGVPEQRRMAEWYSLVKREDDQAHKELAIELFIV